jgi:hypothetical protein
MNKGSGLGDHEIDVRDVDEQRITVGTTRVYVHLSVREARVGFPRAASCLTPKGAREVAAALLKAADSLELEPGGGAS